MSSKRITTPSVVIGIALVVLLAVIFRPAAHRESPTPPAHPVEAKSIPAATPPVERPSAPRDVLFSLADHLRAQTDRRLNGKSLAQLRQELAAMPKDEAVALVRKFLDAKADAPTQLGFKLASNGMLDEAPTLRTFLMDELARLDPAAAAQYARVVLDSMDSPDEWAVALRNLALGDTSDAGRALLEQKTAQMLQNSAWQQNPSVGFLESFDVPVYLGGTNFVPTLSSLLRSPDNSAIAHAAYLSLDRLVINNPVGLMQTLENDPGLMQGHESTRANYFARADIRDPQQRQLLETYLLNPDLAPAEWQTFAGIYPNANFMISPNLLTTATTPDHASLIARDAAALALAQAWLTDPRFAHLTTQVQSIIQRLQSFTAQAQAQHNP